MIVECPGCRSRYDVTGRPAGTRARCRCGAIFPLPGPPSSAGMLACPSCGAGVPPTAHACEYCSTELLVKACPRCFAKIFHGAKHCRECGAKVEVPATVQPDGTASPRSCPRCESAPHLEARLVGDVLLDECLECHGVWLDAAAVERVIEERRQATAEAVLGMGTPRAPSSPLTPPGGRMYIKCPDCETVMNRVNFGRTSGILIDVCRAHGTWFDSDELPRVVDFVMKGGLERSERKQIERATEEARLARSKAYVEHASVQLGNASAGGFQGGAASGTALIGGFLGAIAGALFDD